MRILITGVAGFIGSNLAKEIVLRHKVIGIDNLSYGCLTNIKELLGNQSFEFIEGDILDESSIKDINCDLIVHLASQKIPRYTNSYKTIYDNDKMVNIIIEKCLKDNIRLIFSSTSDIYGKNPNLPFHEKSDSILGPTTVKRWAYATSKIFSEHKILSTNQEHGLEYTIMRFFGSYGENQNRTWWGGPQSVFIDKAMNNSTIEIHGDGKQTRTFTYVKDTVQGIIRCIENENSRNEIFNIASDKSNEISINDLAIKIWGMIRDDVPKLNLIPYETFGNYEDVRRRVPDITKIKELLGYSPKYDLDSGLRNTIMWQKNISSIKA